MYFLIKNFFNLFSFGCAGSLLLCGLFFPSSFREKELLSSCSVWLLAAVASLLLSTGFRARRLQRLYTWAQ